MMGADKHEKRKHNRLPPFVPLLNDTLDSPAWRAMSHGARVLYIAIRRRYSPGTHNNGRIYLSTRQARNEIDSGLTQIGRWFRELVHYGFIVQTTAGCLGLDGKGRAPHWRLTELGHMKEPPTRDFMRWNGAKFRDRKKQNPDPENWITPIQKTGSPPIQKTGSLKRQSDPEKRIIQEGRTDPEKRIITRIPSLADDPANAADAAGDPIGPDPATDADRLDLIYGIIPTFTKPRRTQ